MLHYGADVSNYQSPDLDQGEILPTDDLVIVRLNMPYEKPKLKTTKSQVQAGRIKGKRVGLYVWAYGNMTPDEIIPPARERAWDLGINLLPNPLSADEILWVDCETSAGDTGPNAEWLRRAKALVDNRGIVLGIYTGAWWWQRYMEDTKEFADWPLWYANYNGQPGFSADELFGGWTLESGKVIGKQYSTVFVDRNIFQYPISPQQETVMEYLHWMYKLVNEAQEEREIAYDLLQEVKVKGFGKIRELLGV